MQILLHSSPPLHLQKLVQKGRAHLQEHELREHGKTEQQEQAMTSISSGGATALIPSDGFGSPSASTCQPKSFKLTTRGCVWSVDFQSMVCMCTRFMCSCNAGSVAGRVLMYESFSLKALSIYVHSRSTGADSPCTIEAWTCVPWRCIA